MAERPLALHECDLATLRCYGAARRRGRWGVIGCPGTLQPCLRSPSVCLPSGRRFLIGTEPADQLVCRDANLLSEAAVLMGLLLVGLQAVAGPAKQRGEGMSLRFSERDLRWHRQFPSRQVTKEKPGCWTRWRSFA